jgi:hypothetical protein
MAKEVWKVSVNLCAAVYTMCCVHYVLCTLLLLHINAFFMFILWVFYDNFWTCSNNYDALGYVNTDLVTAWV